MAQQQTDSYPATLDIDYPGQSNRLTAFFRLILAVPILIILSILSASGGETMSESGELAMTNLGGIAASLAIATALMIVFRQTYPRWWFDFALELTRFSTRITAYLMLLTDKYPSTVDQQAVKLNVTYPNVKTDLHRGLPLIKLFLAIPHIIVLIVLVAAMIITTIIAWFAILIAGRYPRPLFDFAVGVNRWGLRVSAYAALLTTDKYPPFSLR